MRNECSLQLVNVNFSYDKKKSILINLNCIFKKGKITALLGANGSGKTTLLKILTGILNPDTGYITLDSQKITYSNNNYSYKKFLGYMPEYLEFYPEAILEDLLVFLSNIKGCTNKGVINYLLDVLNLNIYRHLKIKNLSKGTKQRVNLAQAILTNPKVIVFDEPSNGFDCISISVFYDIIRKLADMGSIVILSSHHLTEIYGRVDYLMFLDGGQIHKQLSCSSFFLSENKATYIFIAFYFKECVSTSFITSLQELDPNIEARGMYIVQGKIKKNLLQTMFEMIAFEKLHIIDVYTKDSTIEDLMFNYE